MPIQVIESREPISRPALGNLQMYLLFNDGRRYRSDNLGCHREGLFTIGNVMPMGYIGEIAVSDPDLSGLVLRYEDADRPIDAGIWIRRHELRTKGGISEHQQRRWAEFDARLGRKLRLVDLGKEHDFLCRHILLDAGDRLRDRIGAAELHDAVLWRGSRFKRTRGQGC